MEIGVVDQFLFRYEPYTAIAVHAFALFIARPRAIAVPLISVAVSTGAPTSPFVPRVHLAPAK
jgi:hypothetical protein